MNEATLYNLHGSINATRRNAEKDAKAFAERLERVEILLDELTKTLDAKARTRVNKRLAKRGLKEI